VIAIAELLVSQTSKLGRTVITVLVTLPILRELCRPGFSYLRKRTDTEVERRNIKTLFSLSKNSVLLESAVSVPIVWASVLGASCNVLVQILEIRNILYFA
jgi:hypothetical protein